MCNITSLFETFYIQVSINKRTKFLNYFSTTSCTTRFPDFSNSLWFMFATNIELHGVFCKPSSLNNLWEIIPNSTYILDTVPFRTQIYNLLRLSPLKKNLKGSQSLCVSQILKWTVQVKQNSTSGINKILWANKFYNMVWLNYYTSRINWLVCV